MCSPQELVELRRELTLLRGHYKDIGKSLGVLAHMANGVDELDERLKAIERAQGGQRKTKSAKSGNEGGGLIDLEEHNGFGVEVSGLLFSRLRGWLGGGDGWGDKGKKHDSSCVFAGDGRYAAAASFADDMAGWCAERGMSFCSPDPVALHIPDSPDLTGSGRRPLPRRLLQSLRDRQAASAERDRARMAELVPVLRRIQVWRRSTRVFKHPCLFAKGNVLLEPRPKAQPAPDGAIATLPKFEAGLFNDSWYQLAVALAASSRGPFTNMFVSCEHRDCGMYIFQFYASASADHPFPDPHGDPPGWRCVVIDDLLPCTPAFMRTDGRVEYCEPGAFDDDDVDSASPTTIPTLPGSPRRAHHVPQCYPIFGLTDQRGEMWAALLQKAYAKFLGGYSLLHRGDTAHALRHLTGGRCEVVQWDPKYVDAAVLRQLWWTLEQGAQLGLLQACQLCPDEDNAQRCRDGIARRGDEYLEWADGEAIVLTAEITVQQVREWGCDPCAREGARLVKVRNLNGAADEWDGDWSHTSPLWKRPAREHLNYSVMDEHLTWMKVADFAASHNTLLVCSEYAGGPPAFAGVLPECARGGVPLHAVQYRLTVENPASTPPGGRRAQLPLGVTIYCSQPGEAEQKLRGSTQYGRTERRQELELRLFSGVGDLLEPVIEQPSSEPELPQRSWMPAEEEAQEAEAASPLSPDGPKYQWPPMLDEVPLQRAGDSGNNTVLRRHVLLVPGTYIVVVQQHEMDAKFSTPIRAAFWSDEDDDGPGMAPVCLSPVHRGQYTTPESRPLGSTQQRKTTSGCKLHAECLGSFAEPRKLPGAVPGGWGASICSPSVAASLGASPPGSPSASPAPARAAHTTRA